VTPMNASKCPDRAELADFAIGNLSRLAFARVADHVEKCPGCQMTLQSLDEMADPLAAQLRQPVREDVTTVDFVPPEFIVTARALRAGATTDSWTTAEGPRRLGKFELLEQLGVGSFGSVFRARDTELDRTVAIKILRAGRLASHEDVDRFLREARSAAQLKHPGIVALYESGQTGDGTCYLVEEFAQGTTLANRITA